MIELVFLACLGAEPATCERKALQFLNLTPSSCMMAAQPYLAEWAGTHPGWRIERWSCEPVGEGRDT